MDTAVEIVRHKLDVDAYYLMAEVGILQEGDRVELIDGEIIDMAPIGVSHASVVDRITRVLIQACGDRAIVRVQGPVRLDALNEPQPDFSVLKPRDDYYAARHPGPGDVYLLVEVADSSLRYDRGVKLPLYARAGVPEVWIVDLKARVVEAYATPSGGQYGSSPAYRAGQVVDLKAMPGTTLSIDQLLG